MSPHAQSPQCSPQGGCNATQVSQIPKHLETFHDSLSVEYGHVNPRGLQYPTTGLSVDYGRVNYNVPQMSQIPRQK